MLRANSKITKTGIYEEPANPNSFSNFFKVAKDWSRLSGYVGSASPQPKTQNLLSPVSPTLSPTNRLEISHKTHEKKVTSALSYLFLRDLGCSREDAIFLTNRNKAGSKELITSLPPALKHDFKTRISKSRCLPCRSTEVDEEFDSLTKAFKNLIIKKKLYYESSFPDQENYAKKLKKEVKQLQNYKTRANPTPVPLCFTPKTPKTKSPGLQSQTSRRVIVPEVPTSSNFISTSTNLFDLEDNLTAASPVSGIWTQGKGKDKGKRNSEKSEFKKSFMSQRPPIMSLSPKNTEPCRRSLKIDKLLFDVLGSNSNLNGQFSSQPSKTGTFIDSNSYIPPNPKPEPDPDPKPKPKPNSHRPIPELNFHALKNEESKLIDLLMIQKLNQGQLKAIKFKEKQKLIKKRKREIDLKQSEEKLARFQKKKEKLNRALMNKNQVLVTRVKSAG